MFYVLVHFPQIDYTKINQIRRQYDPTFRIIDPHITLMFPVPDNLGEENLIQHLTPILKGTRSFPIDIGGFVKSWDHWLFLTLQKGNKEITTLYHKIYSGTLTDYKRPDISFIPHIGLGLFIKQGEKYSLLDPEAVEFDQNCYEEALENAKKHNLNFHCQFDRVHLLKLNDNLSKVVWQKEFSLKNDIATVI